MGTIACVYYWCGYYCIYGYYWWVLFDELDHQKSNRVPEKNIYFCFIDYAKALYGSQQTVENLQEMEIPDHLTCLLRNLYAGQEVTVRTGHGTTDWFQIGKGVCRGCVLSPCLFNLYAEYIMRNIGRSTSWDQDCQEKYR